MRIQSLLLVSLLAGLYGCQPEAPPQEQAAPVETMSSESAAPAEAVVVDAASAVETAVSAVVEVAPVVPVVAAKAAAPAKAEAVVAKVAPAPAKDAAAVPVVVVVVKPAPAAKPAVTEAEAMAVAKKSDCLACHAIDRKVVGPSWADVAAKYRGDATAEAYLINKIAKGGSGVWGSMKMPAHPKLSEADLSTLSRFVLNLK